MLNLADVCDLGADLRDLLTAAWSRGFESGAPPKRRASCQTSAAKRSGGNYRCAGSRRCSAAPIPQGAPGVRVRGSRVRAQAGSAILRAAVSPNRQTVRRRPRGRRDAARA